MVTAYLRECQSKGMILCYDFFFAKEFHNIFVLYCVIQCKKTVTVTTLELWTLEVILNIFSENRMQTRVFCVITL